MQDYLNPAKQRYQNFHQSYSPYYPAIFFILGFLFDVLTLDRIDNWLGIVQQAVYLGIISRILYFRYLEINSLFTPQPPWERVWQYHNEVLHFVLGSLLSTFTLFYFVSASLSSSILFLLIMSLLLVLNELPQLQGSRIQIKTALFALCLFSYFSYLIPIIIGSIGLIPLGLSIALCGFIFWTITKKLVQKGVAQPQAFKEQFFPSVGVLAGLLLLYFLKVLPPIPLAVQYMGIYHNIEKVEDKFRLSYNRAFWKFWQNGAQSFVAQKGDRIYVFARIFSPAYFADEVVFHWLMNVNGEWQTSDRVPVKVLGGRGEGFRAYSSKSNFQDGEWMVKIETSDEREIGRISFDVIRSNASLPNNERNFKVDIQ